MTERGQEGGDLGPMLGAVIDQMHHRLPAGILKRLPAHVSMPDGVGRPVASRATAGLW